MTLLPPVIYQVRMKAGQVYTESKKVDAAMRKSAGEAEQSATRTQRAMATTNRIGKAALQGTAVAAAAVGVTSLKMAGDFQTSTRELVTGAGESASSLGLVRKGLLGMSGQVGATPKVLAEGMFAVESAGFRGAGGLHVLESAAKGARAAGAELGVTTDALTTIMVNYHMKASDSVRAMNMLTAAAAASKVDVQDMASSMSAVLPVAAKAGLSFEQVGGAVATMTNSGMSAQQATQNLAFTIRSLQSPNLQAQKQMQRLGLDSNDLSQNLGKRGLTGTMEILTKAIASHTKGGQVLVDTFNKSKTASADMGKMLKSMPPEVRKLAESYQSGKMSVGAYQDALSGLPGSQAVLGRQFRTLYDRANGFNDFLKQGSPAAQTYTAALGKMTGGATGLNTALMLTGRNSAAFQSSVDTVTKASRGGNKEIQGWAMAQEDFNVKLDQLKGKAQAAGVVIGTALIPPITAAMGFFSAHTTTAKVLAAVIGGVLVAAMLSYVASLAAAPFAAFGRGLVASVNGLRTLAHGYREARVAQSALSGPMGTIGGKLRTVVDGTKAAAAATGRWVVQMGRVAAAQAASAARVTAHTAAIVAQRVAQTAVAGATRSWALAQALLNASFWANPITWVIAGVVALVAAIVLAYRHSETFRSIVKGAMHGAAAAIGWVVDAAKKVVGWVRGHWPLLIAILTGPVGIAVRWIVGHWSQISSAASRVLGWVRGNWRTITAILTGPMGLAISWIRGHWSGLMGWFRGLPGQFSAIGSNIVNSFKGGFSAAWNSVIGWAQAQIDRLPAAVKKVLKIASPSRVFHQLGMSTAEGMARGIKGGWKHVEAALDRGLDKVKTRYDKAKSYYEGVRGNFTQLYGTVRDAFRGQGITERGGTAGEMLRSLTDQAARGKSMAQTLRALKGRGLNGMMLRQLAEAGPEALEQARSILGSGRGGIRQFNDLQRQINRQARGAGLWEAKGVYGKELASSRKAMDRLAREVRELTRAVRVAKAAQKKKTKHNASGTSFWAGGLTAIDEDGYEVIDVPRGARIHTARESAAMASREGGVLVADLHIHLGDNDMRVITQRATLRYEQRNARTGMSRRG